MAGWEFASWEAEVELAVAAVHTSYAMCQEEGREVGSCLGGPVEHRAEVGLALLGGEVMCWGLWLVMGNIACWKQWDNGPWREGRGRGVVENLRGDYFTGGW